MLLIILLPHNHVKLEPILVIQYACVKFGVFIHYSWLRLLIRLIIDH